MTRLRTDLPKIADKEMEEWVKDIVENTDCRDIKILRSELDKALESHERGLHECGFNI